VKENRLLNKVVFALR